MEWGLWCKTCSQEISAVSDTLTILTEDDTLSIAVAHGLQLARDEGGANPMRDAIKDVPVFGDYFTVVLAATSINLVVNLASQHFVIYTTSLSLRVGAN